MNGTTGPSRKEVDAAIKKLKDTKQQATMAALQNSSKWEATTYAAWSQNLFNLVWTSEQVPAWRKGNVTSIFKGGSMDATQCNSYRPITVLPVMTNSLQQSSQTTEQNVHTHDHQSAFREGHSTLDRWPSQLSKQRQRDGLHAHVLPRHARHTTRSGMLACSGSCTRMVASQANWRIIHELYANSASTPIIEGQTTELYRIGPGFTARIELAMSVSSAWSQLQSQHGRMNRFVDKHGCCQSIILTRRSASVYMARCVHDKFTPGGLLKQEGNRMHQVPLADHFCSGAVGHVL
jgi:hypothetical protein